MGLLKTEPINVILRLVPGLRWCTPKSSKVVTNKTRTIQMKLLHVFLKNTHDFIPCSFTRKKKLNVTGDPPTVALPTTCQYSANVLADKLLRW